MQLVVICPALCFFSYCSHFSRAALGTPAVSLPSLTVCRPGLWATCLHTWAPVKAPSYSSLHLSVPRGGGKLFCPQGRRKAQPDLCTIFDGGTLSTLHQCFQIGLVLLEFGVKAWHLNCFPASRWDPKNFCFCKGISPVKEKYTCLAYSFLTAHEEVWREFSEPLLTSCTELSLETCVVCLPYPHPGGCKPHSPRQRPPPACLILFLALPHALFQSAAFPILISLCGSLLPFFPLHLSQTSAQLSQPQGAFRDHSHRPCRSWFAQLSTPLGKNTSWVEMCS